MGTQDTREKGTLMVRCNQPAAADALQIEVRKPNLTLVGVTSPSRAIEVPVGKYHVRGLSSAGLEMSGEVEVVGGQQTELWLQPESAEVAFDLPAVKSAASLRSRSTQPAPEFESFGIGTDPVVVRSFGGNVLLGQAVESVAPAAHRNPQSGPNRYLFSIDAGHLCALQVRMADTVINLVPPISPRRGCTLDVRAIEEGGVSCQFGISDDASVFLNAYAAGQLDAATAATKATFDRDSKDLLELAEDLFEDKLADPIGAILSGLGLLRMGELEMLGEWTGKLLRGLSWSPDAVCVRGEHLARMGQHGEALDTFLTLEPRGLPVFADSLSHALNRLRMYLRVKDLAYHETEVSRLAQRLQRFSSVSDLKSPYVSYTGDDPNEPGGRG